jgi:diadenylate cyclase
MESLQSLLNDIIFRLAVRTWLEGLDLLLVVITFYMVINWAKRRQAAFLLRGALLLGVVLFVVTTVLPLPTFDWLVRGALLAILIAVPVIFHPELRRLLERVGRSVGVSWAVRQTAAEGAISELTKAVAQLADSQTGALFAIEGIDPLRNIVETGVPIGGLVTEDLLMTIFYGENPLHDGAVVIREETVVAASCVLPLTNQPLVLPGRRLGTRHRAAVGLSEITDALVMVVSEETGEISIAQSGTLYRPLSLTSVRERLFDFYIPAKPVPAKNQYSIRTLIGRATKFLAHRPTLPTAQQLMSNLSSIFIAAILALAVWSFVIEQTNPARRALVEGISLRVQDIPTGTTLTATPPATVSVLVQTTDNTLQTLRPSAFQATVSLAGLQAGLHQLPILVNSSASPVRVLEVDPSMLDLELAPIISRTLPIAIELVNQENLSPAFQIVRVPVATPNEVEISGPKPLVEQVNQIRARMPVANVNGSTQELRPLEALDEAGHPVAGLKLQPTEARINLTVQQRLNALDVGVRAITENSPPPGYWLSDLQVSPASLTLQGDPILLAQLESYVDTLPVDISEATGDLTVQIPLNLTVGVQAVDSSGNIIKTVSVTARVTPRRGDLVVTRPVQLIGLGNNSNVTANPSEVTLLLSGPLPTLNEIEANPDLVKVLVNAANLRLGQNVDTAPEILTPEEIDVRVVPPTVLITLPGQ